MAKLILTADDIANIKYSVTLGHSSWSNAILDTIKRKIKSHHLERQENCCCYCNRNIHGEFKMVIDIEHILPKSKYLRYMFTQKNLSVACKRCNMNIKKSDLEFLKFPINSASKRVFRSGFYKFIHPNLDKYDSHLMLNNVQRGRKRLIKYNVVNESRKGAFTYKYFKLEALELNSFDIAQGATERTEINDTEINLEFETLVKKLNSQ